MYPYLLPDVFGYLFPLYDILILVGVFFMLGYVIHRLEKRNGYSRTDTNRILILLIISLLIALPVSYLFDGVFHSIAEGELSFGSITFIGGLIGGVAAFLLLMKFFYKKENKDMRAIMNTVITGMVLAHAFGRIGCFFAGCCYGIPTDSFLGMVFPHGQSHIHYPDSAVFPTQLFEAAFLFGLFFVLHKGYILKHRQIELYLIAYGTWRVLIEFIRGDNRGVLLPLFETQYNTFPTPSQLLSVIMIGLGVYFLLQHKKSTQYQNAL